MITRRLTPEDAPAYRRLRLYGLREFPTAFGASYKEESVRPLEFFTQRLAPGADVWVQGAFKGNRLIGVVTVVRDSQLKARHKAAIYAMYIAPAFRGMGLGRLLITQAVEIARGMEGVRQVRIGVVSSNRPAYQLYRSLGFVEYGKEPQAWLIDGKFYDETMLVLRFQRRRTPVVKSRRRARKASVR